MHTQYSFNDWMARVEKELPEGKTISDLIIDHNLYKHSGFSWPSGNEEKGALEIDEWKILCQSNDNRTLLSSLELGAESIYITVTDKVNFDEMLKGIRLDYIKSIFDFSYCDEAQEKLLLDYKKSNYNGQNLDSIQFSKKYIISEKNVESLSLIFRNIEQDLNTGIDLIYIQYHFDLNFYETISCLRAIRIIFANIAKAYEIREAKIVIECKPNFKIDDFNQQLIRLTFGALASVIGGCDFLNLHPWENFNEGRLAQNIQHLLKHESHLHLFNDAAAGSYLIEDITKQIVDNIWEKLIV